MTMPSTLPPLRSRNAFRGLWPFDPSGTRIPALFSCPTILERLLPQHHIESLDLRERLLRHSDIQGSPEATVLVAEAFVRVLACSKSRETFTWMPGLKPGLPGLADWMFHAARQEHPLVSRRFHAPFRNARPEWHPNWSTQIERLESIGRTVVGNNCMRECFGFLAMTIIHPVDNTIFDFLASKVPHCLPFLLEGSECTSIALAAYLELDEIRRDAIRPSQDSKHISGHPTPHLVHACP